MKQILSLLFLFAATSLVAVTPNSNSKLLDQFTSASDAIDTELTQIHQLNELVIENHYDFDALQASHPALVANAHLSNKAAASIFEGHPDNPLGIPAFWWGFCCSIIGILLVYLTMDEGSERKEQVKNAIYGCAIGAALALILNLVANIIATN